MPVKGAKVERGSVSEQPHELKYEARKEGTTTKIGRGREKKRPEAIRGLRSKANWIVKNRKSPVRGFLIN
jgi:hypothetical protein